MAAPLTLPCSPWATEADLCTPCNDYDIDAGLMDDKLQAASEILYELSGRQFPGICDQTIRPCTRRGCTDYGVDSLMNRDALRGRVWGFPVPTCGCSDDPCSCRTLHQIDLPNTPVTEVTSVLVDGTALDPSLYRVDDYRYLVRLPDPDGSNPGWPCCQDLNLPSTEENTFEVTFSYGMEPPAIGVIAAATLACELYMACEPEAFKGKCRLPHNVIQVTRQGVSVLVQAVTELFTTRIGQPARFGIWEIDLFLRTYNPYGTTGQTAIFSPDVPPTGKRVNT